MADLTLAPNPWFTGFNDLGIIVPGGLLFTYAAGTSNKLATYTDVAGLVANTNPIVLDAAGRVPSGLFLLPASYKFVLAPATDTDPPTNPIRTQDNISATASFSEGRAVAGIAGENLALNDAVYESQGDGGRTAGRWYKMDADFAYASSLAVKIGWASAPLLSGITGQIQLVGRVTTQGLVVPGTIYYASATAGAITATPPINRRIVGVADSAGTLLLGAEQTWTATAQPLTIANSPASGVGGALINRTDGTRGLFLDTGTQWVSVEGNVANVRHFGATGDGTTDDRAAIQAAIDAASTTYAGVVYFPEGAYRVQKVTAQIYALRITKAVRLVGASATGVSIRGHGMGAGDRVIDIDGTVTPNLEHVHLSGLTVMSNDAGRPDLITTTRLSVSSFKNLILRDGRHGIIITGDRTFSIFFAEITCATVLTGTVIRYDTMNGGHHGFTNCSFSGLVGLVITGTTTVTDSLVFTNCNWESCGTSVMVDTTGLLRNLVFTGGRFEKNAAPLTLSPGTAGLIMGVTITGVFFETDSENYAIDVSGAGRVIGLVVQGCYAQDYAQYFVRLSSHASGVIAANVLNNVPVPVSVYTHAGMAVFNNRNTTASALGPQWTTVWTTPTFAAGDFTANGAMTWTVAAGDVQTYAYQIIGKMMTVMLRINTTTVGGTPNTGLQVLIPGGHVSTKATSTTGLIIDNGVRSIGTATTTAGGTLITFTRMDFANWTASADNTYVNATVTFEIDTP